MSSKRGDSSQTLKPFKCPSCGSSLEIEDAPSITCKYCGTTVPVPNEYRSQQQPQIVIQTTGTTVAGQRAGCGLAVFIILLTVVVGGGITIFALQSVDEAFDGIAESVDEAFDSIAESVPGGVSIENPFAPADPGFAEVVLEFGGEGTGPGLFEDARNIGVDLDGNIFVADRDNGRLQKFDADGKFLALFTIPPDERGGYLLQDMAVDLAGSVYVARGGDILKISTEDGTLLDTFPGVFPTTYYESLAVDASNTVYALHVTASDDDLIKLNASGETLSRWISIVSSVNDDDPALVLSMAVDGVGTIYITSQMRDQIYVFDKGGTFVDRFGHAGDETGDIDSPRAITVDGRNHVIILNSFSVDVYSAEGRYLGSLPWDFVNKGTPMGFTTDIEGHIYVITNKGFVLKHRLNE